MRLDSLLILTFLSSIIFFSSCQKNKKRVLIFSKTAEFRHNSIEVGIQSIKTLLESKNIEAIATEDSNYFTEDSLMQYATVIFLNTTGDVLNNYQQADFERYIQAGGGFVGIHSASDTEYQWPWYNHLVGAYFNGHPKIQDATINCIQKKDPCCQNLADQWSLNEEWYNFKSIYPDIEIIMEIDESSYEGGTHGDNHPIVWKHKYDGGKSFYTGIGHKEETFSNPIYLHQLSMGIDYAIGAKQLDYSKAKTHRIPDETRVID